MVSEYRCLYSPTELLKARMRGGSSTPRRWADGKLHKKVGGKWVVVPEGSARSGTPKKPTQVKAELGGSLPVVDSYDEIPNPRKMNAKERSGINKALNEALPGNYYDAIPMEEIQSTLQSEGFVLLQEDGTKWSGMLLGDDSSALFQIGRLSEGRTLNGLATYKPISNAGLMLSWYKMQSGKVEITKYVG